MTKKACSRCGAEFECGSGEPACWCKDLPPVTPKAGKDCLCPACLRAIASRE